MLSLWAQWDRLILEEGLLHRNWESQDGKRSTLQLVIPQTLTHDVLRALHNAPSAGHFGYRKTLLRVRRRFYWPGMSREIEEWCRRCERCASRKTNGQKPRAPLQVSQPSYPMERIALDILGPLPMTARSNRYVLLIGDYYTKWVEAVAIPNQEAKTVARVLLDEFICRFGAPAFIHTEQGRNFDSSLFRELCSLLNIQKTRTTAYHPESDGFVERFNRTLENMLSMYVEDNQTDWDLHLQSVMLAYRSTVQDTTGYTPHFLMTGREINLPIDACDVPRYATAFNPMCPTRVYCPSPTGTAVGIRAGQKKYAELSEATGLLRPSGTRISVQRRRPSVVACSLREAWQNSQTL